MKKKKGKTLRPGDTISWFEGNGMHSLIPGQAPSSEQLEEMTREYQRQIRKSPLFKKMLKQYGKEKAEELLKGFKIKLGK
jgi:hypothetical protein